MASSLGIRLPAGGIVANNPGLEIEVEATTVDGVFPIVVASSIPFSQG